MIKSFKHAGLRKFYETDSKAGILPAHAKKLRTSDPCWMWRPSRVTWISRDGSCIL
jgi:hypothetical protein